MGSFNGTQSAIKAGYNEKSAREMAKENLTKPLIVARLAELSKDLVEKTKLDQKELVEKLYVTVVLFMGAGHFLIAILNTNNKTF